MRMKTEEELTQDAAIGYNIKLIRTRKQMSQRQLAEAAGVSQTYMVMLESGTRTLSASLCKTLADLLEVSPEELLA